jgi:large subunit ribosomal protein L13
MACMERSSGPGSRPRSFDAAAFPQVALVTGRPARADIFTMKTYSPKPEHIEHRWFVMDASGQVLGRLATEIAVLLRGKHKPIFAPHMDTGDHVVVINADKVELTGNKERDKIAYRHSGYPGGIKGVRYGDLLAMRPVAAVEKAVRGMLPKNRLGRQMIKKLHVVAGGEHPHSAQKPVALAVGERPAWEGLPKPAVRSDGTGPAPSKPMADAAPPARKPSSTRSAPPAKEPTAKKTTVTAAKKTTAKKPTAATTAKKTAAKKTAAKKTAAKKTTAKKTTAKKTTAKKTTAKTTATAKKTTAKKTTAKKTTAKKDEE